MIVWYALLGVHTIHSSDAYHTIIYRDLQAVLKLLGLCALLGVHTIHSSNAYHTIIYHDLQAVLKLLGLCALLRVHTIHSSNAYHAIIYHDLQAVLKLLGFCALLEAHNFHSSNAYHTLIYHDLQAVLKLLGLCALLGAHCARATLPPPPHLPWLYDRAFITVACVCLSTIACYLQVREYMACMSLYVLSVGESDIVLDWAFHHCGLCVPEHDSVLLTGEGVHGVHESVCFISG